jgi:UbiA prenyltransferase family
MSTLRAYAQLVRLPNLPTALADICLGALAAGALPGQGVAFGLLLLASGCLYSAGMVWNDYFDQEQDRRERPFRPLPSGRVSPGQAVRLGVVLLAAGVLLAMAAGGAVAWRGGGRGGWTPAVLAVCLTAAVLLYDGWLKRTWAGPVAMGACRSLNVLLGVSACGSLLWPRGAHLALVVGLYIAGVTWFARTEARLSSQTALRGAAAVMLAALLLALPLPVSVPPGQEEVAPAGSFLFPYLLVGLGFVVGLPVSQAVANPTPGRVQAAVKRSLMGLVLLDAVLATAVAGAAGLAILLLLVPSVYLNRKSWLYAT